MNACVVYQNLPGPPGREWSVFAERIMICGSCISELSEAIVCSSCFGASLFAVWCFLFLSLSDDILLKIEDVVGAPRLPVAHART